MADRMPNWMIHLGIAYIFARLLRVSDARLVLLGSILPDVSKLLWQLGATTNLTSVSYLAFVESFHTPLIVGLLVASISQLDAKPLTCAKLIGFGAFTHLLLDTIETRFFGVFWLYPFNFDGFSFSAFWSNSTLSYVLTTASLVALLFVFFEKKTKPLKFRLKNAPLFLSILFVAFLIPILTMDAFAHQSDYLKFVSHPEDFNGKIVRLYVVGVTNEDPLTVKTLGREFVVVSDESSKKGDLISVTGLYEDGKIFAQSIHKNFVEFKMYASVLGLAFLVIAWLKPFKKVRLVNLRKYCDEKWAA